jgi:hypothetical protein
MDLSESIDGIEDYVSGANMSPEGLNQGFTHGFVMTFKDAAARDAYLPHPEHERFKASLQPHLESLAVVTESSRTHLDTRWLQDPGHSGLLVAVVGSVGDHDKAAFARMRHTAATAMAIALDVDAWVGPRAGTAGNALGVGWLRAQGWQAVAAAPSSPLPTVWQDLGVAGSAATRRGPAGLVKGSGS